MNTNTPKPAEIYELQPMETTMARLSTIRFAQLAFAAAAVIAVLAPMQSAEARGGRSGVARDHRVNAPVVRDHRANRPVVRDHRSQKGPADVSGYSGGVKVTRTPRIVRPGHRR